MKTLYLDIEIKTLTEKLKNPNAPKIYKEDWLSALKEYKAIKSLIENSPIVSTPDNPVWVVDEYGNKRILLTDLSEKAVNGRYALISKGYEDKFLNNENFTWCIFHRITPYTPKVNIEVTEDEAIKVEEFLKGLRDGR